MVINATIVNISNGKKSSMRYSSSYVNIEYYTKTALVDLIARTRSW